MGAVIFELEICAAEEPGTFNVEVLHSAGAGRPRSRLVLDADDILRRRSELENTVLASAVQRRRVLSAAEETLQQVGRQLFEALFAGPVYGAYRASLGAVHQQQKRLRLVLRLTAPELAGLPWEALFDPEIGAYLCRTEPLVRHVEAPYTPEPLGVRPPLRILGLVASPRGLPALDVEAEQEHLEEALAKSVAAGLVDLTWAPDASWDTIHDLMLDGEWHILHFIGHGDYDVSNDEGVLALVGPDGRADRVEASRLSDLLSEADPTPRLVVLNSCSSGEAGASDLFSGTAAALVHQGIGAVAAMQFSISDTAAIRFARGFYAALAHGRPVDDAVRSGRIAILGTAHTLEWVTPVLYVRGGSTHLFTLTAPPDLRLHQAAGTTSEPASSEPAPSTEPPQPPPGLVQSGAPAEAIESPGRAPQPSDSSRENGAEEGESESQEVALARLESLLPELERVTLLQLQSVLDSIRRNDCTGLNELLWELAGESPIKTVAAANRIPRAVLAEIDSAFRQSYGYAFRKSATANSAVGARWQAPGGASVIAPGITIRTLLQDRLKREGLW